jgi:hypothetical protein
MREHVQLCTRLQRPSPDEALKIVMRGADGVESVKLMTFRVDER